MNRRRFDSHAASHGAIQWRALWIILLALVAVLLLRQKHNELMGLGMEPTRAAIAHAISLTGYSLLMLAGTLGLIAAVDVPWQIFQHHKQLRMTVRAEHMTGRG